MMEEKTELISTAMGNGAELPNADADSGDQREELNKSNCSSKESNEKLIEASESGDHEGVSRALKEGAEITSSDTFGYTGLHLGAMNGHDSVIKTFLEKGIDVNIRDGAGSKCTALINAAYRDKISCLEILLVNGADPDIKDEWRGHGQTALMYAAEKNYPDVIAELLLKRADKKILNNAGKSATQLAQENNCQDAVKLLEAWGDQEALNQEIMKAARQGRGRLVSGLLRAGADIETTDGNGGTGIDIAIKNGHREAAEAFLDQGVTGYNREECLQQCDENRKRIKEANDKLLRAAESGDNPRVVAALEEGAEITSARLGTGLHYSALRGHQSVLLTLLNRGLDPNIRSWREGTALMEAALGGHLPCVKTLLEHGALADLKDEDGVTALMIAVKKNYSDIAAELLARQPDVSIVNEDKKTALQLAREENNQDIIKLLEAWGEQETLNNEMLTAASKGRGRLVSGLLRAGADLQATDEERRSGLSLLNKGLIVAAKEGLLENVEIFIKSGADVETKDGNGETGIDIAIKKGHRAVAEAFLNQGVAGYNREECLQQCDENRRRINEANDKLRFAAQFGYDEKIEAALEEGAEITRTDSLHFSAMGGHQSVLLTLLTRGLDPNIRGAGQRTALMEAVQKGHLTCVQTLLDHGALADLKDEKETFFNFHAIPEM